MRRIGATPLEQSSCAVHQVKVGPLHGIVPAGVAVTVGITLTAECCMTTTAGLSIAARRMTNRLLAMQAQGGGKGERARGWGGGGGWCISFSQD